MKEKCKVEIQISNCKKSAYLLHHIIREEGLLCGGSCGSVMVGALEAAKALDEGQRCVGKSG